MLAERARADGTPLWIFKHNGQPRAAVGFSFVLLLAAFQRLALTPDASSAVRETVDAMREQEKKLALDGPVVQNRAKRAAGQMVGRWVTVLASDYLAPVARRWKGQISEIAKAWGQFETLPEADHNTLAGLTHPEEIQSKMLVLFLRAQSDNPRNRQRSDLTRQIFMTAGFNTDVYDAKGESPLPQMWTALHFGDYQAYYLAMAYQEDPTPVEAIEGFKQAMSG
jgi:glucose/mannose-6-phosphate isomerase